MYGLIRRAKRLIDDLDALLYQKVSAPSEMEMRRGKIIFPCKISAINEGYAPFENGGVWAEGTFDSYALFRFELDLPAVAAGEDLYLRVATNQGGHNMVKPQMLLYVQDQAVQGLDTNHLRVRISNMAKGAHVFYVYAFCGLAAPTPYGSAIDLNTEVGVRLFVSLEKRKKALADFLFHLKTAYAYLFGFGEGSYEHGKLLREISDSLSLLDLREPHSAAFDDSVEKANAFLCQNLYAKEYGENGVATLVGHTHIDLAWLWRYDHTRDKVLRSFATETKLLEEYPEHKFMSGQAQLYAFVQEQDAELYARIRSLIADGRWEAEGAMWVEPDMNLISGESMVRQLLYGKRFFREEFGVDCEVLWLPDVFGYSAALPQVLQKAGVKYFMTAKLGTNEKNRFPFDTFRWKGIDGSEVFAHLLSYLPGVYNPNIQGTDVLTGWRNYAQKDINEDILVPFGFADGGGGPTEEQVETVLRMKKGLPGVPKMRFGKVRDYFRRLEEKVASSRYLPVWNGEIYYEKHRGTYTSMARIKKQNRRCETLYGNAEWVSVLANALGGHPFPKEAFDAGMKKMLLNQFHDVLPGTSIPAVYEDSDRLFGEAFAAGEKIAEDAIRSILREKSGKVTVFNPHGEEMQGYISENGARYFVEGIPPKGYAVLNRAALEAGASEKKVTVGNGVVESPYYRICMKDGGISSLYDKREGRECFRAHAVANRLRIFEDKPGLLNGYKEDNWNLDSYYRMREFPMPLPLKTEVLHSGGEYAVLRTEWKYQNSRIRQDMVVYARSPRIDFETEIDWHEEGQVLKAEFPVDVNATRATYEIQFGSIERPTTRNTSWEEAKFEVCGHKWADVSDGGYGVALLNDCKYGYSAEGADLSLTLLRCGNSPHPHADKEVHTFTYSILPHKGDHRAGGVQKEALLLNNPLFLRAGEAKGKAQFSLFSCRGAVLDTVKPAEDGRGYILRMYEPNNTRKAVEIRSDLPIQSAVYTDLLEKETGDAPCIEAGAILLEVKPFEIITLRVCLGENA